MDKQDSVYGHTFDMLLLYDGMYSIAEVHMAQVSSSEMQALVQTEEFETREQAAEEMIISVGVLTVALHALITHYRGSCVVSPSLLAFADACFDISDMLNSMLNEKMSQEKDDKRLQ